MVFRETAFGERGNFSKLPSRRTSSHSYFESSRKDFSLFFFEQELLVVFLYFFFSDVSWWYTRNKQVVVVFITEEDLGESGRNIRIKHFQCSKPTGGSIWIRIQYDKRSGCYAARFGYFKSQRQKKQID